MATIFFVLSSRPISFTFQLSLSFFPFSASPLPQSSFSPFHFASEQCFSSCPQAVPLWTCSGSLRVPSARLAAFGCLSRPPMPVSPHLPTSSPSARLIPLGPAARGSSTPLPPALWPAGRLVLPSCAPPCLLPSAGARPARPRGLRGLQERWCRFQERWCQ